MSAFVEVFCHVLLPVSLHRASVRAERGLLKLSLQLLIDTAS